MSFNPQIERAKALYRENEGQLHFGTATAATAACFGMAPLKTIAGLGIGFILTEKQHEGKPKPYTCSSSFTRNEAITQIAPTIIAAAVRPSRYFLPFVVGGLFTNALVRQQYGIKHIINEETI